MFVCECVCVCEVGELDHDIYGTPVYVALEVFDTHTHTHTHTHSRTHMSAVLVYLSTIASNVACTYVPVKHNKGSFIRKTRRKRDIDKNK